MKNALSLFGLMGFLFIVVISIITVVYNLVVNGSASVTVIASNMAYLYYLLLAIPFAFLFAFSSDSMNKDNKSNILNLLYFIFEICIVVAIFLKFSFLGGCLALLLVVAVIGITSRLKEAYLMKKIVSGPKS